MVSYCLILQMKINGPLLIVSFMVTHCLSLEMRWVSSEEKSFMSYSLPWELEGWLFPLSGRGCSVVPVVFPFHSSNVVKIEMFALLVLSGQKHLLQEAEQGQIAGCNTGILWARTISRWLILVILQLCKLALSKLALCQMIVVQETDLGMVTRCFGRKKKVSFGIQVPTLLYHFNHGLDFLV